MAENISVYDRHEHIRLRPGMYIGDKGQKGLKNLITGVLDELIRRYSQYGLTLTFEITGVVGFKLEIKTEKPHPAVEFDEIGSYNEILLCALSALSEKLQLQTGAHWNHFSAGKLEKQEARIENVQTVSIIEANLDTTILPNLELSFPVLAKLFYEFAVLNGDIKFLLKDERGVHANQCYFHFPKGLFAHFKWLCAESLCAPYDSLTIEERIGNNEYRICIGWSKMYYGDTSELSWVNNQRLYDRGTLIKGVKDGIRKVAKSKMSRDYELEGTSRRILIAAQLKTPDPVYGGSTRTRLDMPEVHDEAEKLVSESLNAYLVERPAETERFISAIAMSSVKHD